jgi:predicted membrane protein
VGELKKVEGRVGLKLGILAFVLAILVIMVKLVSLISVFHFTGDRLLILFSLLSVLFVVLVSMITLHFMHALRKPETIEKLYESPAEGLCIGSSVCFVIAFEFIIDGEFLLGDPVSTMLLFVCGILFIISGIMMVREVKEKTEQVNYKTESQILTTELSEDDDESAV